MPRAKALIGLAGLCYWQGGLDGLDRYLLPKLGTPCHRGELFTRTRTT